MAARIVLELKNKVHSAEAAHVVKNMEGDADLVDALVELGYGRDQAERSLARVSPEVKELDARLKEALRHLKTK
jgi:Holliday junction resolvasome RuvABC DNA-binding subunit